MTKKLALVLFLLVCMILLGLIVVFGLNYTDKQQAQTKVEVGIESPQIKGLASQQPVAKEVLESPEGVLVTQVIDGDTIEVEGGHRIRYIGIDTPETVHPNVKTECFGQVASTKNRELVEGKYVKLEKDVSETDKYGRLLRYVYLDQIFINDYLVSQGFAIASSYPPDVKHQDQFTNSQNEARANYRGLWSMCSASSKSAQTMSEECYIKGNISSGGEKIYHTEDQKYWSKTVIHEAKGEKYFCTESEAEKAGFRKSQI